MQTHLNDGASLAFMLAGPLFVGFFPGEQMSRA